MSITFTHGVIAALHGHDDLTNKKIADLLQVDVSKVVPVTSYLESAGAVVSSFFAHSRERCYTLCVTAEQARSLLREYHNTKTVERKAAQRDLLKVTLLSHTSEAESLLLFTKSTRLGLNPSTMAGILAKSDEQRADELRYIASTIRSSWEFVDYTFLIEGVSRAFTHQFVRNRHGSYAQQSMRVNEMVEYDYVMSDRIKTDLRAREIIDSANQHIRNCYQELLKIGVPAEDARGILPTNIATNIAAKFNLRTLSDLAASRTGGRTQEEYRKVMTKMVDAVLKVHPWAESFLFGNKDRDYFDDIEAFAHSQFGDDLIAKGALLKIVDRMRADA